MSINSSSPPAKKKNLSKSLETLLLSEDRLGLPQPLSAIKYSFSGHETFPFRYTWLPKGVQKLKEYPDLFVRDDAVVILGVGKNMVRAIRHWCESLLLIEPSERGQYKPTQLGLALFDSDGWDPYLENPGTLWLLHWQLASRWNRASTWCLAFTHWNTDKFDRDQLVNWLSKIASESPSTRITTASLVRDIEVFLRTYAPSKGARDRNIPLEDTFDCPLVELGLIIEIGQGFYQFMRGPKPSLPDEIFLYALLDFWQLSNRQHQKAISFETLLYSLGCPGGAFKLSENALTERLERLPTWSSLTYNDTAGMRTILQVSKGNVLPITALRCYYKS